MDSAVFRDLCFSRGLYLRPSNKGEAEMSHRRLLGLIWATALALVAAFPASGAQAREGFLDHSFGIDGRLILPPPLESAVWLREDGDGSRVVRGGEGFFGRLAPDGTFDTSFGEGGRLTFPKEIDGFEFNASIWEFDNQGRLLVFGTATDSSGPAVYYPSGPTLGSIHPTWVVVIRYTAAGQIDPTFGEGRGFIRSDFGATPESRSTDPKVQQEFQLPGATAIDLAIDSTDRPILLVGHPASRTPCYGHGGLEWYPYAVVRLTDTGQPDPAFGDGGLRRVERISSYPAPKLALDAAGKISVAGAEGTACPDTGLILTLNQDGAPVGGAADSGYMRSPGRYFAGLAPDGAIIFRHRLVGLGALSRTWPDGRPDRRFGKVRVESPKGARVQIEGILVDREGRVLLGCTFTLPPRSGKPRRTFLAIARLRRNGESDLKFGKDGWIQTRLPIGSGLGQFELDGADRLLVGTGRRGHVARTFLRYVLG